MATPARITLFREDRSLGPVAVFEVEDAAAVPRILTLEGTSYVYNINAGIAAIDLHYVEAAMWVLTREEVNSGKPLPSKIKL